MSFILDALVKADLERQRQGVPGLNTLHYAPAPKAGFGQRWPLWAIGGVLLAAALFLGWQHVEVQKTPAPAEQAPAARAEVVPVPAEPTAVLPAPAVEAEMSVPEAAPSRPRLPAARREAPAEHGLKMAGEIRIRPDSRLYAIAELPSALQKEALQIKVAGFAQASDAGERLAIINDRALREGDELTTGLRVERISSDGVVFNLMGYRFQKGGGR